MTFEHTTAGGRTITIEFGHPLQRHGDTRIAAARAYGDARTGIEGAAAHTTSGASDTELAAAFTAAYADRYGTDRNLEPTGPVVRSRSGIPTFVMAPA